MTTKTKPRGRKPKCVSHLSDVLFDHACTLSDDTLNDAHLLEDFDQALVDGVIDRGEASHIRGHIVLDAHLTDIGVSLNLWANRTCRQVEGLVDGLRARN